MPITFAGQEYASVEAMPPEVRKIYEAGLDDPELAELLALEQAETGKPAEELLARDGLARAWGGSRPEGGVPVPVEFDGVTGLGPSTKVYEPQGLHLPHLGGPPHASALVVYQSGLAYRAAGKEVYSWRFDEVAVIQTDLSYTNTRYPQTVHKYTLTRTTGETLMLDDGVKGVEDAVEEHIKAAVFDRLAPALIRRYQAGEALTFGPVTVQQREGLQLSGKHFAWVAIQDIRVDRGRFQVKLRDGQHHEARTAAMPNVELLGRLIGAQTSTVDQKYY